MTRFLSFSALAVAVALVLAACGGSSSSGGSTASGSSSSSAGYSSSSATSTPKPSSGSVVMTAKGPLGTFLVDAKGRTLYLWDADKSMKSTCNGACAQAWPPLTATAKPKAQGGVSASLLGTTKRADGSLEVTYAGHPLYYFAGDSTAGQTNGQGSTGFGAPWWVVSTGGKALQH